MDPQILEMNHARWGDSEGNCDDGAPWIAALEAGKVLYFPRLAFVTTHTEQRFFSTKIRHPKSRNISLDAQNRLQGALVDASTQSELAAMLARFRTQTHALINALLPRYASVLRVAPTSYRPEQVETRSQSWRADDRRLHVDAFPSRPNRGERILRVFANVNPEGVPRVWRIGEPFDIVATRFLPRAKGYSHWQAQALHALRITKSLRSEYDHLMLQLHDGMKADLAYQRQAPQLTMPFPAGSAWICFSDQTSHAVMSGQYLMEQTFHVPVTQQYDPQASPLAILTRLTKRTLI